jgi:hypothetical protein
LEELMGEREREEKIVRGRRRRRWALEIELLIKYHCAVSFLPCVDEARSPFYRAKDNCTI